MSDRSAAPRRFRLTGRNLVVAVPYFWLLLFFLVPFIIVLKISFSEARIGIPPYAPLLSWTEGHIAQTDGERAAWFKDTEGNILCIHESQASKRSK